MFNAFTENRLAFPLRARVHAAHTSAAHCKCEKVNAAEGRSLQKVAHPHGTRVKRRSQQTPLHSSTAEELTVASQQKSKQHK